jgi:hypothetical protein
MLLQRLLKCRPVPPSRRSHVTTASVSADIRKKIVEQVSSLILPAQFSKPSFIRRAGAWHAAA